MERAARINNAFIIGAGDFNLPGWNWKENSLKQIHSILESMQSVCSSGTAVAIYVSFTAISTPPLKEVLVISEHIVTTWEYIRILNAMIEPSLSTKYYIWFCIINHASQCGQLYTKSM
jgi:ADP-glucose pyrophosphorylase